MRKYKHFLIFYPGFNLKMKNLAVCHDNTMYIYIAYIICDMSLLKAGT